MALISAARVDADRNRKSGQYLVLTSAKLEIVQNFGSIHKKYILYSSANDYHSNPSQKGP